jgi:hypothetical protein
MTLDELYSLVSDDSYAITFQTMGQYRTALLKAMRESGLVARWMPIASAPRDGTNILLRFGSDGVSQGKFVAGSPYPWKFIDTSDGITWLVNHSRDGGAGPSHWMPLPSGETRSGARPVAPEDARMGVGE